MYLLEPLLSLGTRILENYFDPEQDYPVPLLQVNILCNTMEQLLLFEVYQITFCNVLFHFTVQCEHSFN